MRASEVVAIDHNAVSKLGTAVGAGNEAVLWRNSTIEVYRGLVRWRCSEAGCGEGGRVARCACSQSRREATRCVPRSLASPILCQQHAGSRFGGERTRQCQLLTSVGASPTPVKFWHCHTALRLSRRLVQGGLGVEHCSAAQAPFRHSSSSGKQHCSLA